MITAAAERARLHEEWPRRLAADSNLASRTTVPRAAQIQAHDLRGQRLLNAPDITTAQGLRARAIIIAVLLGRAVRQREVAALTMGASSGGFTGGDGRRTARECAGAAGVVRGA